MTSPSRNIDPATTTRADIVQAVASASTGDDTTRTGERRGDLAGQGGERLGIGRAGVGRARHNHLSDCRQQHVQHAADILVAHRGKDKRRRRPAKACEIGRERRRAGRVVRGIENQLAAAGQHPLFQPSRPRYVRQRFNRGAG